MESALQSIIQQDYACLEIIIIDGKSQDDTVSIINKYQKNISFWKSESDEGIYDAWNKGIEISTGEWIIFLGSDDVLLPDSLISYSNFINSLNTEVDIISSKMLYTDKNMKPYRTMGWEWEWPKSQLEMTIAHTGALHSKKLFERVGKFNTGYKIVGDYELLLRAGKNLKAAFLNKVTVMYRDGGVSDSYAAILESFKASRTTGKSPFIRSLLYSAFVFIKYSIRKSLQLANINVYLKSHN